MKSIYKSIGNGYSQQGDYSIPNVAIGNTTEYSIGVWGQRYRGYLKQNHKVIYYNYLTSGKLYEHLAEVDRRAETQFNKLIKAFAEKEIVTETLKAKSPMEYEKVLSLHYSKRENPANRKSFVREE